MSKTSISFLASGIAAVIFIYGPAIPRPQPPAAYAAAAHDNNHEHEHEENQADHHENKNDDHNHGEQEKGHQIEVDEQNAGHKHENKDKDDDHDHDHEEGAVILDPGQIESSGIKIGTISAGAITRDITVPGTIVAASDRFAHIAPRVSGTVTEARKNPGDAVEKGEILALIESREFAEAMAEFQAARRTRDLAHTVFKREKALWEKKISAEQDYLNARNTYQEAAIRHDLARQKLQALGHDGTAAPENASRFHELRAPIAGRVISRDLTLGAYIEPAHPAYTVADLRIVWVETAVTAEELSFIVEGQTATISGDRHQAQGALIFLNPTINPQTRTAKAIIALDNPDGIWRPGTFVRTDIATRPAQARMIAPRDALQTIDGESVLFIRTDHGFEKRKVSTGRQDSRHVEILSGVRVGDKIAVSNTFTLKAELGKSEAEHAH